MMSTIILGTRTKACPRLIKSAPMCEDKLLRLYAKRRQTSEDLRSILNEPLSQIGRGIILIHSCRALN